MGHARIIDFVCRILPFHSWKDRLLHGHVENCPACRERLVSREDARRILVQVEEIGGLERLWPSIENILASDDKKARETSLPRPAIVKMWRLAAGLAVLLAAVALNFWLLQKPRQDNLASGAGANPAEVEQVQIRYVRIENEPAQTFIFQPRDSNIIIVWAGRNQ